MSIKSLKPQDVEDTKESGEAIPDALDLEDIPEALRPELEERIREVERKKQESIAQRVATEREGVRTKAETTFESISHGVKNFFAFLGEHAGKLWAGISAGLGSLWAWITGKKKATETYRVPDTPTFRADAGHLERPETTPEGGEWHETLGIHDRELQLKEWAELSREIGDTDMDELTPEQRARYESLSPFFEQTREEMDRDISDFLKEELVFGVSYAGKASKRLLVEAYLLERKITGKYESRLATELILGRMAAHEQGQYLYAEFFRSLDERTRGKGFDEQMAIYDEAIDLVKKIPEATFDDEAVARLAKEGTEAEKWLFALVADSEVHPENSKQLADFLEQQRLNLRLTHDREWFSKLQEGTFAGQLDENSNLWPILHDLNTLPWSDEGSTATETRKRHEAVAAFIGDISAHLQRRPQATLLEALTSVQPKWKEHSAMGTLVLRLIRIESGGMEVEKNEEDVLSEGTPLEIMWYVKQRLHTLPVGERQDFLLRTAGRLEKITERSFDNLASTLYMLVLAKPLLAAKELLMTDERVKENDADFPERLRDIVRDEATRGTIPLNEVERRALDEVMSLQGDGRGISADTWKMGVRVVFELATILIPGTVAAKAGAYAARLSSGTRFFRHLSALRYAKNPALLSLEQTRRMIRLQRRTSAAIGFGTETFVFTGGSMALHGKLPNPASVEFLQHWAMNAAVFGAMRGVASRYGRFLERRDIPMTRFHRRVQSGLSFGLPIAGMVGMELSAEKLRQHMESAEEEAWEKSGRLSDALSERIIWSYLNLHADNIRRLVEERNGRITLKEVLSNLESKGYNVDWKDQLPPHWVLDSYEVPDAKAEGGKRQEEGMADRHVFYMKDGVLTFDLVEIGASLLPYPSSTKTLSIPFLKGRWQGRVSTGYELPEDPHSDAGPELPEAPEASEAREFFADMRMRRPELAAALIDDATGLRVSAEKWARVAGARAKAILILREYRKTVKATDDAQLKTGYRKLEEHREQLQQEYLELSDMGKRLGFPPATAVVPDTRDIIRVQHAVMDVLEQLALTPLAQNPEQEDLWKLFEHTEDLSYRRWTSVDSLGKSMPTFSGYEAMMIQGKLLLRHSVEGEQRYLLYRNPSRGSRQEFDPTKENTSAELLALELGYGNRISGESRVMLGKDMAEVIDRDSGKQAEAHEHMTRELIEQYRPQIDTLVAEMSEVPEGMNLAFFSSEVREIIRDIQIATDATTGMSEVERLYHQMAWRELLEYVMDRFAMRILEAGGVKAGPGEVSARLSGDVLDIRFTTDATHVYVTPEGVFLSGDERMTSVLEVPQWSRLSEYLNAERLRKEVLAPHEYIANDPVLLAMADRAFSLGGAEKLRDFVDTGRQPDDRYSRLFIALTELGAIDNRKQPDLYELVLEYQTLHNMESFWTDTGAIRVIEGRVSLEEASTRVTIERYQAMTSKIGELSRKHDMSGRLAEITRGRAADGFWDKYIFTSASTAQAYIARNRDEMEMVKALHADLLGMMQMKLSGRLGALEADSGTDLVFRQRPKILTQPN